MRNLYHKFSVLIFILIHCLGTFANTTDSIKIATLQKQVAQQTQKIDSLSKLDNLKVLNERLVGLESKNEGRYDILKVFIPIFFTVLILLLGFTVVRANSVARQEARDAFEDKFRHYCDLIKDQSDEAAKMLSEIRSNHRVSQAFKDKATMDKAVDNIAKKRLKNEKD